ncbi:MuDRA-like transposase [Cucumis melo var. makuwa]|uniref:MuDRA-like transposase n=1 Tax=Cucumis melo var. makuwa TaxID=1194695 RepID=A0A5A7TBN4_CUCMM|nr:MuDRA-like transposase [Cucumis melo var. makuwa]
MDTLDENEVDIGEVQVGLCDNMIETNSAIWESYESYHSKDDTFTWESVEMYNELFDIPEQRDAPTKDCKGKGKVDYSSSSQKLKTKGSGWSEESSTSEELDIYPLAFGVVDRETDDSIQWFLEKLKGAIGEVPNLGFVTDRKTCFAKGISSVFPSAFHGLCVQHLSQNLHDKYKNDTVATLFYNASRTYRESTFVEAWRHLLAFPNGSGKYLNDVGIARWSHVHCPGRRYNMMTTNIAESMNSILKEHRDLPIASFLENVRALLQRWFWERREEGIKVTSTLTKWAELVIQKIQEGALTMKVNPIDCYQFHVKDLDKGRLPVGNQSDWKTNEDYVHMTVLPLKVVKRVGRPKKKRIPSVGEAPKLHKCGRCKQIDG